MCECVIDRLGTVEADGIKYVSWLTESDFECLVAIDNWVYVRAGADMRAVSGYISGIDDDGFDMRVPTDSGFRMAHVRYADVVFIREL